MYNEQNNASNLLQRIGDGCADEAFASAVSAAVERSTETGKPSKIILTVTVEPSEEDGCIVLSAEVTTKLPKLPAAATHMHVGPDGALMAQASIPFAAAQA